MQYYHQFLFYIFSYIDQSSQETIVKRCFNFNKQLVLKTLRFFSIVYSSFLLKAQSNLKLTDYYNNPSSYNPAYVGVTEGLFLKAIIHLNGQTLRFTFYSIG